MRTGRNSEKNEKSEWTSIKIRRDTYEGLIRARAYLEMQHSRRVTFDETLKVLFTLLGEYSAREAYLRALEESKNEGED